MPARLATICLTMVFLVGISSPTVRAQDSESTRATLKGITAVYVVVEELRDSAKVLGLTKDAIRTDVELKLRLAGIRVVETTEEWAKLTGSPFLYVNVNVLDGSARVANVEVELDQDALLARNGEFASGVTTWSAGGVLVNPDVQYIRDRIKDAVDKFLNAWLSVNPKK
jgi:hypothetical protein